MMPRAQAVKEAFALAWKPDFEFGSVHASQAPWVIGIDPGKKGAIAALRLDLSGYAAWKMPVTSKDVDVRALERILSSIKTRGNVAHALIEEAGVMPAQGVSSALTIGRNYGILIALLELCSVPFVEMRPNVWKKSVIGAAPRMASAKGTGRTVENKAAAKAMAMMTARRMFPAADFLSTQDGPAEALLMAEAARRLVASGNLGTAMFPDPEAAAKAVEESMNQPRVTRRAAPRKPVSPEVVTHHA